MHGFTRCFLSPDGGQGGDPGQTSQQATQNQQEHQEGHTGQQAAAIDYAKIQQMLDGTLKAKEDTALRDYFKQQGLSKEEAEQAMAVFKQQKAASQPDVNAIQTKLTQAQEAARQKEVENKAIMTAVELGIDVKSIPYILKMADFSQVLGQDGAINEETLKAAVNKVLEDVPALKPQPAKATGFMQVGVTAGQQTQPPGQTASTQLQIAAKRWNRFNN